MDPKAKVYTREANVEIQLADQYNTARLFKTYAFENGTWNQAKVDRLAILLLSPDALPRQYVAGDNSVALPYFRFNTRLARTILTFLTNEGLAEGAVRERIQYQGAMIDYIQRGIDPSYIDAPWREVSLDYNEYYSALEGFGKNRDFIVDVLSDQLSPFQNTMSDFLSSRYIFQRTRPQLVNVLGGQVEPEMRVFQLKNLKGIRNDRARLNRMNLCDM